MEVKIGVQNVARELSFETDSGADDISSAVAQALVEGTVLSLTDTKGRRVLVPSAALAYVHVGETEKGRVGFGTTPSS